MVNYPIDKETAERFKNLLDRKPAEKITATSELRTIEDEVKDFKRGFEDFLEPLEILYNRELFHLFTEEKKDCCCCAALTVEITFEHIVEEKWFTISQRSNYYDHTDSRSYGARKAKEIVLMILNEDVENSLRLLYMNEHIRYDFIKNLFPDSYSGWGDDDSPAPPHIGLQTKISDIQVVDGKVNFEIQKTFRLEIEP